MIRRDARLADGAAAWILISQVEHARISAELAEHCLGRFHSATIGKIRNEVLAAIRRHDDGWLQWEQSPRLHVDSGWPVSFMELETAEALSIWSSSIEQAATHGPLAGWMVAGHFCRLLGKYGDPDHEPEARVWYEQMQKQRAALLEAWRQTDRTLHSVELADESLQWLWTFDEVSLWFCLTCPSAGDNLPRASQRNRVGRGTPIEMELSAMNSMAPANQSPGIAVGKPWRFDAPFLAIEAPAQIVPAAPYESSSQMLAAGADHVLQWHFQAENA
jgi:hypothetical protein